MSEEGRGKGGGRRDGLGDETEEWVLLQPPPHSYVGLNLVYASVQVGDQQDDHHCEDDEEEDDAGGAEHAPPSESARRPPPPPSSSHQKRQSNASWQDGPRGRTCAYMPPASLSLFSLSLFQTWGYK